MQWPTIFCGGRRIFALATCVSVPAAFHNVISAPTNNAAEMLRYSSLSKYKYLHDSRSLAFIGSRSVPSQFKELLPNSDKPSTASGCVAQFGSLKDEALTGRDGPMLT